MSLNENEEKKIGIIGYGFSGLATLTHLIKKAKGPLCISIFDKDSKWGGGVAYGGNSEVHPLNVRACNMGLEADRPSGFFDWLNENESLWKKQFPNVNASKNSYLPRKLYGLYLKDAHEKILSLAKQKQIQVKFYNEKVLSASHENSLFTINGEAGSRVKVEYLILALGAPTTKRFPFESNLEGSKNYIRNIWFPDFESVIPKINPENILFLGSGLTAVDALFSLRKANYKGNITIVSAFGCFPEAHLKTPAEPIKDHIHFDPSKKLLFILKEFREKAEFYKNKGCDWRSFFDTLRPYTSHLWHELDYESKLKFLDHLFILWNRHRHRMSYDSLEMIKEMSPKLLKGFVTKITKTADGKFEVLREYGNNAEKIVVDCVVNCAGPIYNLSHREDSLISSLVDQKIIFADELNMGLKIENLSTLYLDTNGKVFGLAALLFGQLFETTAVPEIRSQASTISETILYNFDTIDSYRT